METPRIKERRSYTRVISEFTGEDDERIRDGILKRVRALLERDPGAIAIFSATAGKVLAEVAPEIILKGGSPIVKRQNNVKVALLTRDGNTGEYTTAEVPPDATVEVTKIPGVSIPETPTDPEAVRTRADRGELKFEFTPTHTMAMAVFRNGKWTEPQCMPAGSMESGPLADRYGQDIFGGSRAVRLKDGRVALFRPDVHAKRFNDNAEMELMPHLTDEQMIAVYEEVVKANVAYIGRSGEQSLYLAPGLRATGNQLGVHPNIKYTFTCLGVPAGNIFSKPSKFRTETRSHRVAKGEYGQVKHAGHYSPTFGVKKAAKIKGYDDVIFLDESNEELRESSSSNVFFVTCDGILVTPNLSGEILKGITRDSILVIGEELKEQGIIKGIEERPISRDELYNMAEAFSCGTGVTMNGIEVIDDEDISYTFDISDKGMGKISRRISNKFNAILAGEEMENPRYKNWVRIVE